MQKLEGIKGKGSYLGEKRKVKKFSEIESEVADFSFYPKRVVKQEKEVPVVEVENKLTRERV